MQEENADQTERTIDDRTYSLDYCDVCHTGALNVVFLFFSVRRQKAKKNKEAIRFESIIRQGKCSVSHIFSKETAPKNTTTTHFEQKEGKSFVDD